VDLELDRDAIIDGLTDALLTAEIPLGCLDRRVTKKKLDLLQFPISQVAQPRAAAPQVMGRQSVDKLGSQEL